MAAALRAELQRGQALKQQGRRAEAEALFRALLAQHGELPEILSELGVLAAERGASDEAAALFGRAVDKAPREGSLLANLGAALTEIANYEAAIDALERAAALNPSFEHGWNSLARTLNVAGEPERALEIAGKLKARNPNHAGARLNVIRSLGQLGRFADAEAEALEIIERWPTQGAGYVALAPLRRFAADDPLVAAAQRVADAGKIPSPEQTHLSFALGKMYDDAGDVDRAFAAFAQANARSTRPYDRAGWDKQVRDIIETYSRARIEARRAHGYRSETPVLVVGMPRSGTTLLESVLAAHPEVGSVGEAAFLPNLNLALPQFSPREADLNTTIRTISAEAAEMLGHRYVRQLKRRNSNKARVVDKMPHNFLNLGLAALITPEARFIRVRRSPAATALSVWMQNFNTHHPYAARFEDIAHHYALYRKLMAHWRDALGERLLEVKYESVVNDPAGETKRMLEFIGLPSGELELERDRALRVVATASVWQVRQPIHRNSIDRGSAYAHHLGPLKRALAEFGIDDGGAARETESA